MTHRVIFVGGPSDGVHAELSKLPDFIGVKANAMETGVALPEPATTVIYRREEWAAGKHRRWMYVIDGMPIEEALDQLWDHYAPGVTVELSESPLVSALLAGHVSEN